MRESGAKFTHSVASAAAIQTSTVIHRIYSYKLNFLCTSFDANVKLGYERMETQHDLGTSRRDNSNTDSINTLMLGLYRYF